jgi:hypothetical protein
MALMTIMLRRDPQTGKQNVVIKLDSEADALPHEHEQMHRQLVEKLIGHGLDPEDLGEIVVEREPAAAPAATEKTETPPERPKEANAQ